MEGAQRVPILKHRGSRTLEAIRHIALDERASVIVATALVLTAVPVVAHFFYSWIGFNPTDEGFILAYSRRLLDGQVPHRDFIAIRPTGSSYLHIIDLLIGGDYTLWISRLFVWFELACTAWM